MKYILILSLISMFSCSSTNEGIDKVIDLEGRTYVLDLPYNYNQNKTYDLLVVFHGAKGSGSGIKAVSKFRDYTDDYIIVYPDALVENWEEGCRCNKPYRLGIDDIGFIRSLVLKMKQEHTIGDVFGAGYSQGGLFAHNVADKLSILFKAVAVVAAPMSLPLSNELNPVDDVSVLMIHGTKDTVLPYHGEDAGSFSLISSPDAFNRWVQINKCDTNITVTPTQYYESRRTSNTNGTVVQLNSIINGGHYWNYSGFNSSNEILKFFNSL